MWTYEQRTGKLYGPDGHYVATGYAGGDKGLHPEGINNPDLQNVHNIGPLPCGFYTREEPIDPHPHLGKYAIPLTPDKDNEMFGRSGFFMHGDNVTNPGHASDGCIIQGPVTRHEFGTSSDKRIQVVSDYAEVML